MNNEGGLYVLRVGVNERLKDCSGRGTIVRSQAPPFFLFGFLSPVTTRHLFEHASYPTSPQSRLYRPLILPSATLLTLPCFSSSSPRPPGVAPVQEHTTPSDELE
jgi:hypothetical protein